MKKLLSILLIMLLMLCDMRVAVAANGTSVTYIVKPTLDYGVVLNFHDGFAAVKKNGKYGIIDKTGKEVVPVIYEYVTNFWDEYDDTPIFYEGMARVARFDKNGYMKWGFIDKTGKEVIAPIYNGASNFYDGIAIVNKDGTWCFIDKTGKVIIPQISNNYYEVHNYHEGLAAVEKNVVYYDKNGVFHWDLKWGFINTTGKEIIPTIYDMVSDFSEGFASVEKDGKWGVIDKTGKEVVPPIYDYVSDFHEGLAKIEKNYKCGFIDKTGKVVIPLVYSDILDHSDGFSEGLAVVEKAVNGTYKFGYIDKTGKDVIPAIYDWVSDFHEGLAAVRKDFKWGYIDKTGKVIIPFIYSSVGDFYEGIAPVEEDGKWGIIANPFNASEVQKTISNSKISAIPINSQVLINDKAVSFEAYNINGYNYFKLRDLAKALNGTQKQFEISWNPSNNVINITSGNKYTESGGELSLASKNKQIKDAIPIISKLYINGKEMNFTSYNIEGYNYFKLRDIATALDFGTTWDESTNTIRIDTSIRYTEP
jgi:hypothetical protein